MTRLDDEYGTILPEELERQTDAGRAPSDDAYIGVETGSVFDQLRVVDHSTTPGRTGPIVSARRMIMQPPASMPAHWSITTRVGTSNEQYVRYIPTTRAAKISRENSRS